MDIQAMIDAMGRMGEMQRSNYHLTLGDAISLLEAAPSEATVTFDGGGYPTGPHSYRGYYSDLALRTSASSVTVEQLLAELRAALGETFEGYKGGDFTMHAKTPLWAAAYGCCGPAIVGLTVTPDGIVLTTKDTD